MRLSNKIVLISGIGPGLGVKLAVEAARAQAAGVIVAARSADKLDDAEARIRALGLDTPVLRQTCDITDRAQCEALVQAGMQRFGRIDALVNSAFVHGAMDYVSSADLDSWMLPLNTNLLGTLRLTQAVLPVMRAQRGGAIVMINTMATRQVPPLGEAGYAASKAALANAARYLAKEVGRDGICVNSVYMGWMWGAPVQGYFEWQAREQNVTVDQLKAPVEAGIALGRIPTDDECARAALFLASDDASAITGASLDVNGGAYMP